MQDQVNATPAPQCGETGIAQRRTAGDGTSFRKSCFAETMRPCQRNGFTGSHFARIPVRRPPRLPGRRISQKTREI